MPWWNPVFYGYMEKEADKVQQIRKKATDPVDAFYRIIEKGAGIVKGGFSICYFRFTEKPS